MGPHSSRVLHVLVAEDDAAMRSLVADALRKDGYRIDEAADGARALLQIAAAVEPLDLIVSDIRMPGCSGLEMLRAIRDAGWRTPVILMTAFGNNETRVEVEKLGAVLFDKPFQLGALRATARRLLEAR